MSNKKELSEQKDTELLAYDIFIKPANQIFPANRTKRKKFTVNLLSHVCLVLKSYSNNYSKATVVLAYIFPTEYAVMIILTTLYVFFM